MELELKHLSPYLPYNLGIKFKLDDLEKIDVMAQLNEFNVLAGNSLDCIQINELKPILRPLSDLTKEIEVNRERFIPIKKIHELDETNSFDDIEKGYSLGFIDNVISIKHNKYTLSDKQSFSLKYLVKTSNMGDFIYSFTYDPEIRRFLKRNDTENKPLGIGYQIDMFNKLFEWHFDIYGLIEKGLAIDVNTI